MKKTFIEKVNMKISETIYFLFNPKFLLLYSKRFSDKFSQSDLEYCIAKMFEHKLGKKLDFNNVITFNEKLNWLKCFYHNKNMTECADKVTAPDHFMKCTKLDERYIVKNIGIYDNPDEIDFEKMPDKFVLKSNWGSGKQIIIDDKKKININKIINEVSTWNSIKSNHYYTGFEFGYKNIIPKIVCEEFIDFDYKIEFFCFNGKPIYFWTIFNDKTNNVCADFYDAITRKKIKMKQGYPNSSFEISMPLDYDIMFDTAEKLSKDYPFVRIDFFKTKDSFKFSEMTFYHWCGFMPFEPNDMDYEFGKHLSLPEKML